MSVSTFPDGGPAYPSDKGSGMSLRDWFAGMALQIITKNMSTDFVKVQQFELSEAIYRIADAMLKEREKFYVGSGK